MKILPVSEFPSNSICFEAKKDNKKTENPQIKTGVKAAVPTAALVLAMLADPLSINEAEAQPRRNNNIELHHPQRRQNHMQPHHNSQYHPAPHHHHQNYVLPTLMMMNYINSLAYLNNVYTSPVSIGGVALNKNDIAAFDSYLQDGVLYNNVILSNGTSVTYPTQSDYRYPMIYRGDGGYVFEGLSEAFISGSNNIDRFTINGCRNTTVDIGNDNRVDRVIIRRSRILPGGIVQYSQNVDVMAGRDDIINNQRIISEGTYNFGL